MSNFRADHVGSLLRSPEVKENRNKWKLGQISAEELRVIEDAAIAETVKKLEATGMKAITDGEFRRDYFHLDFLKELAGVTVTGGIEANPNAKVAEDGFKPPVLSVTGKLKHVKDIQVADFNYLKSIVTQTPKVTIPSPTMIHFRGGRKSIDINSYPDMDVFFADLAAAYREEINHLYEAGLRYLQLDDTNLAYLCDPKMRAAAAERGEDPNELPRTYAALINSVIDNRPADLTVGIHLCRGNYRSTWFAEGGYEPVAEILFNEINVDRYLLEYDDERSGDFAPLRFVPKNKKVVLGIVSSKKRELENIDDLCKRIDEAAQYAPLENLCVSPQCGFSSTHHGNDMSHDDQWRKLDLVVNTALKVWGEA
ncbi:Methionine synthase vitamin-B12 independent [Emticicia oligotrophica DSM 17448]|jgi:5-methyltetrahydropteroyltriglutamate--homocysteine methyltransferase|uniref:Methionine synthase vitamin-B12 independent n=1 Tax=Emticicia oligotrophica (strain DSM 17448 / CIP 109782 / MTCC 6937 / GPTSA100-15) TaxID=929562 RepID=A0ABM5MZW7_EMTOG|nr:MULTISPECIES: 5-methyltetrahydropteroyltriglutamate--homocysteine S-methyltransferase [Emticicia]AFK02730.1 Methionine synthase vitamin-B12 independent [Emticicia oligotrophica DSM 17448]